MNEDHPGQTANTGVNIHQCPTVFPVNGRQAKERERELEKIFERSIIKNRKTTLVWIAERGTFRIMA